MKVAIYVNNVDNAKEKEVTRPKPTPFFLMLIVGDNLFHNNIIDSKASMTIMPKQVVDALKLEYELLEKGIMQLDGKKVLTIDHIKYFSLNLFSCPSQMITQEIVVIDIPSVFRMCLSRDFTRNIGGYSSARLVLPYIKDQEWGEDENLV